MQDYVVSYKQAYADNQFRSRYPWMWKGLKGAWCPCLGPTGSTLIDNSGFRNDGTLTNMDASNDWIIKSKGIFDSGYALNFDGTDDFVNMGNPTELQITTQLTLSAWFQTSTTGSTQDIITKDASPDRCYNLFVSSSDNKVYASIFVSDTIKQIGSASTVTDGEWHHVLCTYDKSNFILFLDGVDVATLAETGDIDNDPADFRIGARGAAAEFNGNMDDIRVYDRALSEAEVFSTYEYGPGAMYKFDFDMDALLVPPAPTTKNYYTGDFANRKRLTRGLAGV